MLSAARIRNPWLLEKFSLLSSGVLAHLERLEAKSRKKFEEPQGASAAESALGSKIRKLRSLRDKLRAEVEQRQAGVSGRVMVGRLPWCVKSRTWDFASLCNVIYL